MPIQVLMPALSPTMEKGNLAKWVKKEGDKIAPGDVIAEIETDKATMEVEAVDEGTLGQILVPEGTADVAVNTPIATILSEGEDASALKTNGGAQAAQPAAENRARRAPGRGSQGRRVRCRRRWRTMSRPARRAGRPRLTLRSRSRLSQRPCRSRTCRKAPRWSP